MKEAIRYAFLTEWVHQASTEEIVEKLIQNDERAKIIKKATTILEGLLPICIMPNNTLIHGTEKAKEIETALEILRGDKND